MKIGRWVVDCHIHCGKTDAKAPEADPAHGTWAEVVPSDNSELALLDMDAYGIDMGILLPSFTGTTNEMHAAMVRRHPDRFRSCCMDTTQRIKAARGEAEWTIEAAIKEIDETVVNNPGVFVGIGEFAPGCMGTMRKPQSYQQRLGEWAAIAEVAIKHDLVAHFHEYERSPGQVLNGIRPSEAYDILAMTCSRYPKCKILINHGGGQREEEIREACHLAASFPNLYLETGYWKAEHYEMAIHDQNVTCKRLIWGGGDTGSRIWMHHALRSAAKYLNEHQVFYNRTTWPADNMPKELPYQPDWYGWATHQIHRLKDLNLATQDQINLIVGGNAARIYRLPTPKPLDEMFAHGRPDLYIR
jgi:predicted TIM-barrel fold metal-dependent hydrolase